MSIPDHQPPALPLSSASMSGSPPASSSGSPSASSSASSSASPSGEPAGRGEPAIDWAARLRELDERARVRDALPLPIAWLIHAWASEVLVSAAIRIDGSEGLIGPAPVRWRVLVHVETPGFAVTILDGRAPLRPDNVVASLLVAPERPAVISVRGQALARPVEEPDSAGTRRDRQGVTTPAVALTALVDVALGRSGRVSGSAAALPPALWLGAELALRARGWALATSTPARRGPHGRANRRPQAFVATHEPATLRRQLLAAEARQRQRQRQAGGVPTVKPSGT